MHDFRMQLGHQSVDAILSRDVNHIHIKTELMLLVPHRQVNKKIQVSAIQLIKHEHKNGGKIIPTWSSPNTSDKRPFRSRIDPVIPARTPFHHVRCRNNSRSGGNRIKSDRDLMGASMTVMRRGPAPTRMRTLEAATPVCVAMPHRSRASPARLWMILEGAAAAAAAAASRTRKRRRCEASGRGKLPSDRARRVSGPGTGT